MSLRNRIPEDIKNALKNKNPLELTVLRMLQAAIKNKEIDKSGKVELSDEEVIEVVNTEVKKRRDAAKEYENVSRQDAADQERAEIEILMKYMPAQLGEDEIRAVIKKAVLETQATSMKDMGKVMKLVMPEVKGKADGSLVSKIVKEELDT